MATVTTDTPTATDTPTPAALAVPRGRLTPADEVASFLQGAEADAAAFETADRRASTRYLAPLRRVCQYLALVAAYGQPGKALLAAIFGRVGLNLNRLILLAKVERSELAPLPEQQDPDAGPIVTHTYLLKMPDGNPVLWDVTAPAGKPSMLLATGAVTMTSAYEMYRQAFERTKTKPLTSLVKAIRSRTKATKKAYASDGSPVKDMTLDPGGIAEHNVMLLWALASAPVFQCLDGAGDAVASIIRDIADANSIDLPPANLLLEQPKAE